MKKSLLLFAAMLLGAVCSYAADVTTVYGVTATYHKSGTEKYNSSGVFSIVYDGTLSTKNYSFTFVKYRAENPLCTVYFDNTGYITYAPNTSIRKVDPYFVVNVEFPSPDCYAVFHSYKNKSGSDITEIVFIYKNTKEKDFTLSWSDPGQADYNAIRDMFVSLIGKEKFNLRDFDSLPKAYFSDSGISFKAPQTQTYTASNSTSTSSGSSASSSGKSSSGGSAHTTKTMYIDGGEIFCEYLDGQLVHTRTTYTNSKNYDDCLFGADGFSSCLHYAKCPCNGSKKCISCGGMKTIPYFGTCWGCAGTGRCNCDENGYRKTVTNSGGVASVPRTIDVYDGGSSYSSSSSNSSSSGSSRYGYYDCKVCYHTGVCQVCQGKKLQDAGYTSTVTTCGSCHGTGRCSACGGSGSKYGVK